MPQLKMLYPLHISENSNKPFFIRNYSIFIDVLQIVNLLAVQNASILLSFSNSVHRTSQHDRGKKIVDRYSFVKNHKV